MPRGDNRVAGVLHDQKGPVSQRELVRILPPLIDIARGKAPSRSRDEARRTLREILATANWLTPFVLHNLHERRCRYLVQMGYIIPARYLLNLDTDRSIKEWRARQVTR